MVQAPTTTERIMGTRLTMAMTMTVVAMVAQKPLDLRKLMVKITGSFVRRELCAFPLSPGIAAIRGL